MTAEDASLPSPPRELQVGPSDDVHEYAQHDTGETEPDTGTVDVTVRVPKHGRDLGSFYGMLRREYGAEVNPDDGDDGE